jgi:protein-tyrosine phosphatase
VLYAVTFTFFAVALAWAATDHGGIAYALFWPALSFLLVALGYGRLGPAVFGKRPNGTRTLWASAALLPYLALSWLIWSARRCMMADACGSLIAPGIWLGRRPYLRELPEQVACVVDLACEFPAASGIAQQKIYLCLPVLDTRTPSSETFVEAVRRVAACPDGIYVHCAAGHGRSAMFVAALLVARGLAQTPPEALQIIRNARPAIRLSREQQSLLEQVCQQLNPGTQYGSSAGCPQIRHE